MMPFEKQSVNNQASEDINVDESLQKSQFS